ncbi:MAG: biotin/lipoate protein ligase [Firmicutes bacterium]|nr:biotin/lipoate protein ligase [Bacillota bacterium]
MKWRIIESPALEGAANMAIDEAIMLAQSRGEVLPTLRFYRWSPAAVSMGYFQKAQAEIDFEECSRRGIDVVRRLTGGRAVLHQDEITYSLIVNEEYSGIPPTITGSYRYFSAGLVAGLKKLGVKADMSIPRNAYGARERSSRAATAACFDSASNYEIICNGRKLVGSAQVRKQGVVLQHGSLLLSFCAEDLAAILRFDSEDKRREMAAVLNNSVTSMKEILGRKVSWEETRAALLEGMEETLHITACPGMLTREEQAVSQQLTLEKYSSSAWTCKR